MKKLSYIVRCFWDKKSYVQIFHENIFVITLIFSLFIVIPETISFGFGSRKILDLDIIPVAKKFPDMTIKDGCLSIDSGVSRFEIKTKDNKLICVFDSEKSIYEPVDENDSGAICVYKDGFFTLKANGTFQTRKFPVTGEIKINSVIAENIIQSVYPFLIIVYYLYSVVVKFSTILLDGLIFSLAGFILRKETKMPIDNLCVYKLAVYLSFPSHYVSALISVLNLNLMVWPFELVITCGYLIFAFIKLQSMRKDK